MNNISTTTVYRIHLEKGGQRKVDAIFPIGSIVGNINSHLIKPVEIYQLESIIRVPHKDKLYERLKGLLQLTINASDKSPFVFINSREQRDEGDRKQNYPPLSASLATIPMVMSNRTAVMIDLSSQGKFIRDGGGNIDHYTIRDKNLYGMLQMATAAYQLNTAEESVKTLRKLLMLGAKMYSSLIMRVFNRSFGVTYRTSASTGSMSIDVYHLLKYAFTYYFINAMAGTPAKTAKVFTDSTVGRETSAIMDNSGIDVEKSLTVLNMCGLLKFLSSHEAFRKITTKSGDSEFSSVMLISAFSELYGPHTLLVADHFLSFVTCMISAYHKMDLNKFMIIESTIMKDDLVKFMEIIANINRG